MAVMTTDTIKRYIASRYAILYLLSPEDERMENTLRKITRTGFNRPVDLYVWTSTEGLTRNGQAEEGTKEPLSVLDWLANFDGMALFLLKDFHLYLKDPVVVRRLRDVYNIYKRDFRTVFISGPVVYLPDELQKEIAIIDINLPNFEEMNEVLDQVIASKKNLTVNLDEHERDQIIRAVMGLSEDEGRNAFTKALLGTKELDISKLPIVMEEKKQLIKKTGVLEFIDQKFRIEDVGGLENLKKWLAQRRKGFGEKAREMGIEQPKGLLMTGVPGCGKSLCVQAVAADWRLPLLRLDMDKIYGGTYGAPEDALRRALQVSEALAPCVLWIDEIEKGIAGTGGKGGSGGGPAARVFALFITWMQEKEAMVFISATANEINLLPPEILRKGRFDEIFFVDLPSHGEREEIWKIHLERRKNDSTQYNLNELAKATEGYNGAEIEQIVIAAQYESYNESRPLTQRDLLISTGKMVPLAKSMAEKIQAIKRWADDRATKASKSQR